MSTAVFVTPVAGPTDLETFVRLPEQLHREHAGWVPPLRADERRLFNPRRNLAYRYCDAALWLARRNGNVVGRVAAIVNRRHNEITGEKTVRFSHLECIEDFTVAEALLDEVERWAAPRGMDRVVGPFGFTDLDPEGFIVEGFDEETSIATYHNFPYLVRFLCRLGYGKHVDYLVYKVPVPAATPPLYEKILERVRRKGVLRLLEFTRRRQLKPLIVPVLDLLNETYVEITGYSPLDRSELDDLAKRWIPALDPRFVKVVDSPDGVVGFVIGIPCMNDGFRRAGGRLFPLGWWWVLKAAREATRLDLLLGGIKESYRGRGVDALMGTAMMRSARAAGFTWFDSHHELENNTRIQAEMARMGGVAYKRYRVFEKAI